MLNHLPDVTSNATAKISSPLQWVGMESVAVPISIECRDRRLQSITAKANVFVNIDNPKAKGIHMSRLHRIINQLAELECNKNNIEHLLNEMVESQPNISNEAKIQLAFEVLLKKPALLSEESGYQSYPITITAEKNENGYEHGFEITIPYSSTCPCSASLARQLYSDSIDQIFTEPQIDKATLLKWVQSEVGSIATPHSQRSYAYIRLSIGDSDWPNVPQLIFQFESIIGTPVQTAVKRSDEQEFARLNATNLMFCEDAARRIKKSLDQMGLQDYYYKIEHQESLHAHNAVVIDQKC